MLTSNQMQYILLSFIILIIITNLTYIFIRSRGKGLAAKNRFESYDSIALPIYVADFNNYEILFVNQAAMNLFGNIVGMKCYQAIHSQSIPCLDCTPYEACLNCTSYLITDNKYVSNLDKFFDSYECLLTLENNETARLCLMVDTTEKKRLLMQKDKDNTEREELIELLQLQGSFIDSAKSMFGAIDLDGNLIFVNKMMTSFLGYTNIEFLEYGINCAHSPEAIEILEKTAIPSALAHGQWRGENTVTNKAGQSFPTRQAVFPIKSYTGEIIALATIIDDISEEKKMEEMFQWQLAIMDSSQDYISVADLDGRVIYNSPGAYRMMGYEIDDHNKLAINEVFDAEYYQIIKEVGIAAAFANGQWSCRSKLKRRNGLLPLPIEQRIFPVYSKERKIIGAATIIRDITETIKSEELLNKQLMLKEFLLQFSFNFATVLDFEALIKDALEQLSSLLNADRVALFIDNNNSNILVNKYVYEFHEIKSCPDLTLLYGDHIELYDYLMSYPYHYYPDASAMNEIIKPNKSVAKSVLLLPLKTESDIIGLIICSTLYSHTTWDENELNLSLIAAGLIANAFARQASGKKVREAERNLRSIINTTPFGIFWKDTDLVFQGGNTAFARDLGCETIDDIIGKTSKDLFSANVAKLYDELELSIFQTKEDQLYAEEVLDVPNLDPIWISISRVLIKDELGNPISLLSVYNDITEQKKNKYDLELATQKAEEASQAKSEFLSRMSHEIRTPLNAIIGMTLIGKNTDDLVRIKNCLSQIDIASKHLLGLVNDILDMSKIEANKLEIVAETFAFQVMLNNIIEIMAIKMQEKNIAYSVHCDPNIPANLIGDELRLSQILNNLLSNAIKFTPEDGSIILNSRIQQKINENESMFYFEVIDNGIGISPEQQSRLFSSFEQADGSIARSYGGTGLGLAICKSIVEMMGGEIGVSSKLGNGSCFYFTARLKHQSLISANVELLPDPVINLDYSNLTFSRCNLLLVEDIDINRMIACSILEKSRINIDYAENGARALEMFEHNPNKYDIILMDIQMPIMDGLEATRRIRALGTPESASIPIIAMTANAFIKDIEECKKAGMQDHIGKPIDIRELTTKIAAHLYGKEDQ